MDREAWRAAVHGVAKRCTQLSDWTELTWTNVQSFDNSFCLSNAFISILTPVFPCSNSLTSDYKMMRFWTTRELDSLLLHSHYIFCFGGVCVCVNSLSSLHCNSVSQGCDITEWLDSFIGLSNTESHAPSPSQPAPPWVTEVTNVSEPPLPLATCHSPANETRQTLQGDLGESLDSPKKQKHFSWLCPFFSACLECRCYRVNKH